ncbi:hypothetical protein DFH11DRAFT_1732285 [Phellopilus nigrolimitatus]|nr:hypothetical protein DFH11DRAFT_1732285 [Phellopilus nigrolimitatus]
MGSNSDYPTQYPPPGAPEVADKRRGRKPKDADSMSMRGPPTPVPKSVVHVPGQREAQATCWRRAEAERAAKVIPRPAIRALLINLSGTLHIASAPTTVAAAAVSRAWQAGFAVRFCSNTSQEIARARAGGCPVNEAAEALRPPIRLRFLEFRSAAADHASYDSVLVVCLAYGPLNRAFHVMSARPATAFSFSSGARVGGAQAVNARAHAARERGVG